MAGNCPQCLAQRLLTFESDAPILEDCEPVLRRMGDFELLEEIARGGMGIVFRARQISLDRPVAVKLMRDGAWASSEAVDRFRAEAANAGRLRHPNIVRIHEVGEEQGHHFIAMDLIEGRNLDAATRSGPLPPLRAAHLVAVIAQAIQHAHELGVLHRDLKPSNVLLDAEGAPFVTDFGLARPLEGAGTLTLTGQVLGTPAYIAPEQAQGQPDIGPAADIYGLGALLYHLVTGRAPFPGDSPVEVLKQVVDADPPPPELLNPQVPKDLSAVCLKCLEKSPRRRYGSAAELAEDLGRYLRGEPTAARPAGRLERTWRWCHRRPALAILGASLAFTLMAGFLGVVWQWRKAVAARDAAETSDRLRLEQMVELYGQKARMARGSGRPGQRTEALSAAAVAAAVRPTVALRNDAIAALLLPDLGQRLWWREQPDYEHPWCFDPDLDHYLPHSESRQVAVHRSSDQRVVADLGTAETQVAAACFSPDGRFLAVRLVDGPIRAWEWRTGRRLFQGDLECAGAKWEQRAFDFTPDSRALYFAAAAGGVQSAEIESGRVAGVVGGDLVTLVRVSPNGCELLAVRGARAEVWDLADPVRVRSKEFQGIAKEGFSAAAWHPGGDVLALAGTGNVVLWQCRLGGQVTVAESAIGEVSRVFFNSTGELLFANDSVWDVASQARLLDTLAEAGLAIAIGRSDRRIAFNRVRKGFGVWEFLPPVGTRTLVIDPTRPRPWNDPVTDVSPDGRWVASVHADGWGVWDGATARVLVHSPDPAFDVKFSEDGRSVLVAGVYGLRRWPLAIQGVVAGGAETQFGRTEDLPGAPQTLFVPPSPSTGAFPKGPISAGLIAPGGRFAALSDGSWVVVHDVAGETNRPALRLRRNDNLFALSADGCWLTSNRHGNSGPDFWDANTGERVTGVSVPAAGSCQFDRFTGDFVAWNSSEYSFLRPGNWSTTLRKAWPVEAPIGGLVVGSVAPDRRTLFAATDELAMALVDRVTGTIYAQLERKGTFWGHTLAIDPQFRRVYLSTSKGAIRVLDILALREELKRIGLDWNDKAPGDPMSVSSESGKPQIDRLR